MTAQEAIKNITAYAYMEAENIPMQVVKAFDVAREALEKQISKKYEVWNGQASCPRCKKLFGCVDTIKTLFKWEMEYCKYCGQKLDWSEVNERT